MNSCNPVFIETGLRTGVQVMYQYFDRLGLMEKSGIDLPGEASSIMHQIDNVGDVELATISFGQSFQITPIQMLRAVSAVINGGKLITPHLGVRIVDAKGNMIRLHYNEAVSYTHLDVYKRQPAACGAFVPFLIVHARHSSSPAVRKLIRPSRL